MFFSESRSFPGKALLVRARPHPPPRGESHSVPPPGSPLCFSLSVPACASPCPCSSRPGPHEISALVAADAAHLPPSHLHRPVDLMLEISGTQLLRPNEVPACPSWAHISSASPLGSHASVRFPVARYVLLSLSPIPPHLPLFCLAFPFPLLPPPPLARKRRETS